MSHNDFIRAENHGVRAIRSVSSFVTDQSVREALALAESVLTSVRQASQVLYSPDATVSEKTIAAEKLAKSLFGKAIPHVPVLMDVVDPSCHPQAHTPPQDQASQHTSSPVEAEMLDMANMDMMHYGDPAGWADAWLTGQTRWKPDNIPMPQWAAAGPDLSPMPQSRKEVRRACGKQYITHVSPGVHAECIGFISEFTGLPANHLDTQSIVQDSIQ